MRMDRLRKSFRESFRKKKEHIPESSKPHQWQADEQAVRSGSCMFPVKYLGCVEVFESRGMQVCEEALKVLRVSLKRTSRLPCLIARLFVYTRKCLCKTLFAPQSSRRRPLKALLHVTGDGLRVVDEETKVMVCRCFKCDSVY